jgi:outer membrane receptor protein involved in Fe transport
LKLAPGIYLSQHAGQGKAPQIFLRGFDAEHGQDVEVLVGGLPINEASNVHGQGYADPTFIPAEAVRTLRVKEGTYDPRQGDFAVAGTVGYDLGLPDEGATLRLSGGQYGLLRGFVGFRPSGFDDKTFVAGELVRGDGFGPSRSFERGSALAQGAFDVMEGVQVRVLGGTSTGRFSSAGVLRLEDVTDGDVLRFATYEAGQGGSSTRHFALAEATLKADDAKTTVSLYATRREISLRHNFTGELLFDAGDTVAQTSKGNTAGINAEYDKKVTFLDAAQHLVVGVQARGDDLESTQDRLRSVDGVVHTREVDAAIKLGHAALFGEAVLRLLPGTTLRAGARAEGLSFHIEDHLANGGNQSARDTFSFFVGPRLAADWRALSWLNVQAAYGEGFRTPQALALARAEVAPATRVRSGEAGVRIAVRPEPRADRPASDLEPLGVLLSTFVTHVEQDRVFDHATATSLFIGPTLRAGVTGLVTTRPTDWFEATASGTFVKAVLLDDYSDVPFAPPLVTRVDARVHDELFSFWGTALEAFGELGASAVGARPLPFGDTARPLALLDGAAGVRAFHTTLSVECFNILDSEVYDGEFVYASRFSRGDSGVPARHVTMAPPRLLQATLSVTF